MAKLLKYLFSSRTLPIIVSTSLMLIFIGIYFLAVLKSRTLIDILRQEVSVLVEFTSGTSYERILEFQQELKSQPGVIGNSVLYTSKEDAYQMMREELGEMFPGNLEQNPFMDVVQFNIENRFAEDSLLINDLKERPEVHNAFLQMTAIDEISRNIRNFTGSALVIGLFFTLLAVLMIYNALNLSLAESKKSFYTLKVLGANWAFIKRPFLQRSFYTGLFSAIIAVIVLISFIGYLKWNNPILRPVIRTGDMVLLSLFLLGAGLVINMIGTQIILSRFLSMKEEDIYRS